VKQDLIKRVHAEDHDGEKGSKFLQVIFCLNDI
jgi:hypothetical protein